MSHIYSIKFDKAYFSVDAQNGRIERVASLPKWKQIIDLTLSPDKWGFFAKRKLNQDAVSLLINGFEKEAACVSGDKQSQRIDEVARKIFSRLNNQLENEKDQSDPRRQKVLAHFIRYVLREDSPIQKTFESFHKQFSSFKDLEKKAQQVPSLSTDTIDLIFGEGFYRYNENSRIISEFCPIEKAFLPSENQIDLNGGAVQEIDNLRLVFERRRHCQLKAAQNENNELEERLEPITKRDQQKAYNANKKAHHQKIQKLINKGFKQLNANLARLDLIHDGERKAIQTLAIQTLLKEKIHVNSALARLKEPLFDRKRACPEGCFIASMICPELSEKKEAFKSAWKEYRDDPSKSAEFKRALEKYVIVQLEYSKSLGVPFKKIGKGTGGARFGFSLHGLRICVVKPEDEGPYGINNPTWTARFKRFIGKRPCIRDNLESLVETAAFQIDQQMDMCLVPPTSTVMLNSPSFINKAEKMCSVQMFVDGTQEFCEMAGLGAKSKRSHQKVWLEKQRLDFENSFKDSGDDHEFEIDEKRELKKLTFLHGYDVTSIDTWGKYKEVCEKFKKRIAKIALLDHRLGNTDCHLENILIKIKKTEDLRLLRFFQRRQLSDNEIDDLSDDEIDELTDSLFLPVEQTAPPLIFSFGNKTYQLSPNQEVEEAAGKDATFKIGGEEEAIWLRNLSMFIERRKGQQFSVNDDGQLIEIEPKRLSRNERKEIQKKVHGALLKSFEEMDKWLSKTSLKSQEKIAVQKMLSEALSKKGAIGRLKSTLFKQQMFQSFPFLHELITEKVKIPSLFHQLVDNLFDANEGEAMLIKIDGGSALPHQRPSTYFEMMNSYGFEVLPQMKQEVPKNLTDEAQDLKIIHSMLNLAALNFSTILDDNEYKHFLEKEETLALIKKWILKADVDFVKSQLVEALMASHETDFAKSRALTALSVREGKEPSSFSDAEVKRYLIEQIDLRQKMFSNELDRIRSQAQLLKERYELELANSVPFDSQIKDAIKSKEEHIKDAIKSKEEHIKDAIKIKEEHIKDAIKGKEQRMAEALYGNQELGTLFTAKLGKKMIKRREYAEKIPELRERLLKFKRQLEEVAQSGAMPLSEDFRKLSFANRLTSSDTLFKSLVG